MSLFQTKYVLDAEGTVYGALAEDPMAFINDRAQELYGCRTGRTISDSADLILSVDEPQPTQRQMFQTAAFCAAGAICLTSFMESDLSTDLKNKTQKLMLHASIPSSALTGNADDILELAEFFSIKGLAEHPEFTPHSQAVKEYFTSVTQDAHFGHIAEIGGGFTAHLLDLSLDKVVNRELDKLLGCEVDKADWDSLLS